jgi:hypothetical protein
MLLLGDLQKENNTGVGMMKKDYFPLFSAFVRTGGEWRRQRVVTLSCMEIVLAGRGVLHGGAHHL